MTAARGSDERSSSVDRPAALNLYLFFLVRHSLEGRSRVPFLVKSVSQFTSVIINWALKASV